MYGKTMRVPDNLIIKYFTLATRVPGEEVAEYERALKRGDNPRDCKMKLASELVRFYHGLKQAQEAESYFVSTFHDKEIPEDITELKPSSYDIVTALVEGKLVKSKAEARRAIEQGGVKVNEEKVTSIETMTKPGDIIQKGKR